MRIFIRTSILILFTSFTCITNVFGITRVSACSGNWGNSSTWSPSGTPACGDSVIIQAAHTVSLSNQQNYTGCGSPFKIVIYGTLKFYNGSKLSLPCGSYVLVYAGGKVEADVGLSNSNYIEICSVIEWNSNSVMVGPACIPAYNPLCQIVLPIELSSFNADICMDRICLNWETATENNNDHFEVERSADGLSFTSILKTDSKAEGGNSHYKIIYTGIDESPMKGINYYRLKQVDKDYTYTNSKIITVQNDFEEELKFSVYPNLNSGEFFAQISGLKIKGGISIILKNASGAIVYKTWQYVNDKSAQVRVVPGWKLPDGIYFCSFIIGETEHVVKIIVTNS